MPPYIFAVLPAYWQGKQSKILIDLYWQVNKDNGFSNINLLFSSDSTQKICLFHRTLHIMQVCPCKINWNIGN